MPVRLVLGGEDRDASRVCFWSVSVTRAKIDRTIERRSFFVWDGSSQQIAQLVWKFTNTFAHPVRRIFQRFPRPFRQIGEAMLAANAAQMPSHTRACALPRNFVLAVVNRVDQSDEGDTLAGRRELLRHLQCSRSPEGISSKKIWA